MIILGYMYVFHGGPASDRHAVELRAAVRIARGPRRGLHRIGRGVALVGQRSRDGGAAEGERDAASGRVVVHVDVEDGKPRDPCVSSSSAEPGTAARRSTRRPSAAIMFTSVSARVGSASSPHWAMYCPMALVCTSRARSMRASITMQGAPLAQRKAPPSLPCAAKKLWTCCSGVAVIASPRRMNAPSPRPSRRARGTRMREAGSLFSSVRGFLPAPPPAGGPDAS